MKAPASAAGGLLLAALLALAPAAAGAPAASTEDAVPSTEDLFRWGEYDSLIREMEPWLAAQSTGGIARFDSASLAKANLYLGVAYHVTGKPKRGDEAFARACRLYPGLILDRLYATPQIAARFEEIAKAQRAQTRSAPAPARMARSGEGKGSWKWWTAGAMAAVGAAGGTYWYYVSTLPPRHERNTVVVDGSGEPVGQGL